MQSQKYHCLSTLLGNKPNVKGEAIGFAFSVTKVLFNRQTHANWCLDRVSLGEKNPLTKAQHAAKIPASPNQQYRRDGGEL
jgi:hypothetical protein